MTTTLRRDRRLPFAPVAATMIAASTATLAGVAPDHLLAPLVGSFAGSAPFSAAVRAVAAAGTFAATWLPIWAALRPLGRRLDVAGLPRKPKVRAPAVAPAPKSRRPIFAPEELGAPLMSDEAVRTGVADDPALAAPLVLDEFDLPVRAPEPVAVEPATPLRRRGLVSTPANDPAPSVTPEPVVTPVANADEVQRRRDVVGSPVIEPDPVPAPVVIDMPVAPPVVPPVAPPVASVSPTMAEWVLPVPPAPATPPVPSPAPVDVAPLSVLELDEEELPLRRLSADMPGKRDALGNPVGRDARAAFDPDAPLDRVALPETPPTDATSIDDLVRRLEEGIARRAAQDGPDGPGTPARPVPAWIAAARATDPVTPPIDDDNDPIRADLRDALGEIRRLAGG